MNKYRAKKVTIDGYIFDSQLEARRYGELKILKKAGKIWDLVVHPAFPIFVRGVLICNVELDFQYREVTECLLPPIYEDCKGYDTPLSRLKRKLFEAQYGVKVELVRKMR